jgi:hypothetical protein
MKSSSPRSHRTCRSRYERRHIWVGPPGSTQLILEMSRFRVDTPSACRQRRSVVCNRIEPCLHRYCVPAARRVSQRILRHGPLIRREGDSRGLVVSVSNPAEMQCRRYASCACGSVATITFRLPGCPAASSWAHRSNIGMASQRARPAGSSGRRSTCSG